MSPKNEVIWYGMNGNKIHRYTIPFEVLNNVGRVAHKLAFSTSLSWVHLFYYVSMPPGDKDYKIKLYSVLINENLSYEEEPIVILDYDAQ